jgi:hypothetical protein
MLMSEAGSLGQTGKDWQTSFDSGNGHIYVKGGIITRASKDPHGGGNPQSQVFGKASHG